MDEFVHLNGPLPFPDGSFDTFISTDVLEHIREPVIAWSEMAWVLRPGGKLIVSVPFPYSLHEEPHDYHRHTRY